MLIGIYGCGVAAYCLTAGILMLKIAGDPDLMELAKEMKASEFKESFWEKYRVYFLALIPGLHWLYVIGYTVCIIDDDIWEKVKEKIYIKAKLMMMDDR